MRPKNDLPIKGNGSDKLRPPPTKAFQEPRKGPNGKPISILSREASATLRDQLLAELEGLELDDGLDAWTLQAWPKANTLTPADGDEVRLAFQARLGRLQTIPDEDLSPAERDRPTANQEMRSRHCAGHTIANCTAPIRKRTGGRKPVSSPSAWRASFGWKPTPSPLLQTSWATSAKSLERRTMKQLCHGSRASRG
jgi:hypothetical protein